MKKKTMAGLIAIVAVVAVVMVSGCVEEDYSTTLTPEDQKVRICEEVAHTYYNTHTYIQNDVFDCDNMACDVWNMLKTKGVNAEIAVGNVDLDEYDIKDWNHAWIMAEVAPNTWLAIECTGGYIVYGDDNPRYYNAHFFNNPKSLRDFSQLYKIYQTQSSEYNNAANRYNALVEEYNNAGFFDDIEYLEGASDMAKLEMEQKRRDIDTTESKLEAILEWG